LKSGVLNLYKAEGFTSHDAVAVIRRLYGTKKVGHTGTLDPQAVGVLPILIGNAVKACDLIPEESKIYRACVRFGLATDTEDIWGKVIAEDESRPEESRFRLAMSEMVGEYWQIPPMVSAIKVNGKKLYEYARDGVTVPREPRRMEIRSLELLSFSREEACIRAEVSKGTYIRTLLCDLCEKNGVLGTMSALTREKSGIFSLENTVTLETLEQMSLAERESILLPTEQIFDAHPIFELPDFFDALVANGCAVALRKLKKRGEKGQRFRLYRNGSFFALGEIVEAEGELCLRAIKHFPVGGE
jgi:tRNA pseudouridine55 synthase